METRSPDPRLRPSLVDDCGLNKVHWPANRRQRQVTERVTTAPRISPVFTRRAQKIGSSRHSPCTRVNLCTYCEVLYHPDAVKYHTCAEANRMNECSSKNNTFYLNHTALSTAG